MLQRPVSPPLSFAVVATLAGCGGGHGSDRPDPVPVVIESEPNDDAFHANFLGTLAPGDELQIRGKSDLGPFPFDGFAFVSGAPLAVQFALSARDPSADLDLWVYDAELGDFVLLFEDPLDPEVGSFEVAAAGAEFHLVVMPFSGASDYTLEVVAACGSTASEGAGLVAGRAVTGGSGTKERRTGAEDYRKARGNAGEDEELAVLERRGVLVEVDERGGVRARPLRILLDPAAPDARREPPEDR